MFANPLGLLALLGIPAILAIHFLQRKAISIPVSTLFLIERTQRETASGRRFDRLTPSIPLWMQLLAVVLLTWFLAEPRFQKENSVQRVAVIVDSSASMAVFKADAINAIRKELPTLKGAASKLELTLLPSMPGTDRLYSGTSIEEFSAALTSFSPSTGQHDITPTLRLARSLVSSAGAVIFVTDTPAENLPFAAQALSVGKSTPNVGFTGVTFLEIDGALTWQALVRNYGDQPAERTWHLQTASGKTEERALSIGADSFTIIQGAFPTQASEVRIVLSKDAFPLDDILPIVAPQPKELKIFTATSPAFRDLNDRLLRSLAAATPSNDASNSDLSIVSYDPLEPVNPQGNAIVFVEDPTSSGSYLSGGILAESHPLMNGINWQALLVRETLELPRQPTDRVLLWQEKRPLIFLRQAARSSVLCFNFDLRLSNATQQPAFIVLLHRFAESIRSAKIAPESLNLETSQPIRIATNPGTPIDTSAFDTNGKSLPHPHQNKAPTQPGFFTLSQNGEPLLTAAVHFADTREADLRQCAPASLEVPSAKSSLQIHTKPDPLWRLWLLFLIVLLLVAWHFTDTRSENPSKKDGPQTALG